MAEATTTTSDTGTPGPKYPAPKDKVCQFCGVAFTSSSLGRHLDQFIKDKKPKAPDDVHDVDEIRRLRGNITRRQPRNSLRSGGEASTPVATPTAVSSFKEPRSSRDHSSLRSPSSSRDTSSANHLGIPDRESTAAPNEANRSNEVNGDGKRPGQQRSASRQAQKAQFDTRTKLAEAMDTAKAAELALRELVGSFRAAK
jgi:hypothetical protein